MLSAPKTKRNKNYWLWPIVTLLVAFMTGVAYAEWGKWVPDYFDEDENAWIKVCQADPESCECDTGEGTKVGCGFIVISTGNMHPSTSLEQGRFQVSAEVPTPSLWTPASMRYVLGYGIYGFSHGMTGGGVPAVVSLIDPNGGTIGFLFDDEESVGIPYLGPQQDLDVRLIMIDAEGWTVTNDPAYYDLYPGNGERYRFVAATNSDEFAQLVEYETPQGRIETVQDIGTEVIQDENDVLRQVMAPSRFANIVVANEFKYSVSLYRPTDVQSEKDENGYYVLATNASPLSVWTMENPETNTLSKLRVTEVTGGRTNVSDFVYHDGSEMWELTKGGGLRKESRDFIWDDNHQNVLGTHIVQGADDVVVKKTQTKYHSYSWGLASIEEVVDPDGAALTTEYTYYTDSGETGRYGNRKSIKYPDGDWATYDYNSSGYKTLEVRPWKDSAFDSAAGNARATYYDYTPVDPDDSALYNDQRPRKVTEKVLGATVSKTYHAYATNAVRELQEIEEKCVDVTASYGDSSNLRTVLTYYGTNTSSHQTGRLKSKEYPDGRLDTYTYEYGTYHQETDPENCWFESDPDGSAWRETIVHGTTNSADGVAYKSTKEVKVLDSYSQEVLTESYVYTGGTNYDRIAWAVREFDDFYHPIHTYYSTGEREDATWGSGCCGKESETTKEGIEYTYGYDLLNRMISMIRKGTNSPNDDLTRQYTYDAADSRLTETVSGGGLSMVVSSNSFDVAGRLTSSFNSLGLETTYAYQNGGRTRTVVSSGNATNITENYLDGRTKSVSGNAVVDTYYNYGTEDDGDRYSTVYTGPDGTGSPMWARTVTDPADRRIREETPGSGGAVLTNSYVYSARNLLSWMTSPGVSDTLYEYDELGNQTRSGLDIDGDGTLDLGENDRITDAVQSYEKDGSSIWWQKALSKIYPTANSATPLTNSVQKMQLTGLSSNLTEKSVGIDVYGNETVTSASVDRDNKTVTRTVDYPDSTNDAVNITVNGLLVSSETKTGLKYQYGYDGLERRTSVTDPRTGTSITHYNSLGQVDYVEDAATNRTSYGYSAQTGRRIAVTNALGQVQRSEYDVKGQLIRTWGDTAYPVSYTYNDYGRMASMSTYRDGSGWSDASWPTGSEGTVDTTTWQYEDATGLLTNKLYADGNGTAYSYTSDGKLETRTWARGITTTYSYTNTTGQMIGIDYSDDTPDISFSYDRLGRQSTITDAQGTRTFGYDPTTLALTNETIVADDVTNIIARTQDSLGRESGLSMGQYSVSYGFDGLGRFSTLTASPLPLTTNVWHYSYLPDSALISVVSNQQSQVHSTKSYESHRDLITQVRNMAGTNLISRFDYVNDALARRTKRIDTSSSITTNLFGYNTRSELVDADMGTNDFGYVFDNIGNRETATNNAEVLTYLSNQLNQYTNIHNGVTNTPTYDLDGNMLTYNGWTFTWNGENRLIKSESLASVPDAAKVKVENVYDYMGRRVRKTVSSDYSGGTYTTTNVTTYVWDGFNIIAEMCDLSAGGGSGYTNWYTYGLDLSGSLQGAGGVGGALAMTRDTGTATNTYLYCFDGNGNVVNLVDADDGSIAATYEYSPFGQLIRSTGTVADDNPVRWSTKHTDDETGLVMYELRTYSPSLGRFLSRDPIWEWAASYPHAARSIATGIHLYAFLENNPISRFDVDGRGWFCDVFCYTPWAPSWLCFLVCATPIGGEDLYLIHCGSLEYEWVMPGVLPGNFYTCRYSCSAYWIPNEGDDPISVDTELTYTASGWWPDPDEDDVPLFCGDPECPEEVDETFQYIGGMPDELPGGTVDPVWPSP